MSREPIVICGITRFAETTAHYFQTDSDFEVVGFTAHERFITMKTFWDRPVVPIEQLTAKFPPAGTRFFCAIEYKWLNAAREQVIAELKALGYQPASFIHPQASVCPTVKIGEHCFVMEGSVLCYRSVIGSNNVVSPRTLLAHRAQIGSHNYLSPGVSIDRDAIVGDHCYLGSGTYVAEACKVGDWCYTRPMQEIFQAVSTGTTFNPTLRAPGRVVDRRVTLKTFEL